MRDTLLPSPPHRLPGGPAPARNALGVGLGLKPEHFQEAWTVRDAGLWFEVHAENYMVDGGPRIAWLERIRACHPVSLHGVGLSLGGDAPPDAAHLARLAALAQRIQPALVSEHLAWSVQAGVYLPDLLPVLRTDAALQRIVDHVDQVQQALGRRIAIENPSHYLPLEGHTWSETDFLAELSRRSGCGLLLDLNNVFVSARNLGFDPLDYLTRFPHQAVMQLHLAGHSEDPALGAALLVDSHDAPVAPPVWALYRHFLAQAGQRPVMIERDAALPPFAELMAERAAAVALADAAAAETAVAA